MRIEELKVRLWQKRYLNSGDNRIFEKVWHQVKNLVTVPYGMFPECSTGHWDSIKMLAVLEGLQEYDCKHTVVSQHVIEVPHQEEIKRTIAVPKLITLPGGETKIIKTIREVIVPGEVRTKLQVVKMERESEMTLLSFLRFKMEQAVRSERRDLLLQRRNIALDDTYADNDDHTRGDEICFKSMSNRAKLYPKDPEQKEEEYQILVRAVEERLQAAGEIRILRAFRLKLKYPAITNRKIAKTLGVSKTYTSSYFRKLELIIEEVIENTDTLLV